MHAGAGYDAFYTTAVAVDAKGVRWNAYIMAAQYKRRVEVVMFMSNAPPGPLAASFKVFQQFLGSLRFGDTLAGSAPVPDPATQPAVETPHNLPAGALEGIYAGYSIARAGMKRLNFISAGR